MNSVSCPGLSSLMTDAMPEAPLQFAIRGPIARSDLAGLYDRVCRLLADSAAGGPVLCDVHGVPPDAVTVDALARLQLAASRRGSQIHLRGASDALRDLLGFMGLGDVIPE